MINPKITNEIDPITQINASFQEIINEKGNILDRCSMISKVMQNSHDVNNFKMFARDNLRINNDQNVFNYTVISILLTFLVKIIKQSYWSNRRSWQ